LQLLQDKALKKRTKTSTRGKKLEATKIKDILRRRDSKLSMNEISQLTGVSKGSVINVMKRAVKATVDGEKAQQLSMRNWSPYYIQSD